MPNRQIISFTCPDCNQPFDLPQWNLIYAEIEPDIAKKARDGSLFRNTCPHCGKSMLIAYDCLYGDRQKNFIVTLQANRGKGGITPMIPKCKLRIEYTLAAFVERIRILDAGLDDMALEAFRTLLLTQLRQKYPDKNISGLRFDAVVNDDIFFQLDSGNPNEQVKVGLAHFWRIEDKIRDGGFRPDIHGYLNIHGEWVKSSGILNALLTKKPQEE